MSKRVARHISRKIKLSNTHNRCNLIGSKEEGLSSGAATLIFPLGVVAMTSGLEENGVTNYDNGKHNESIGFLEPFTVCPSNKFNFLSISPAHLETTSIEVFQVAKDDSKKLKLVCF
ncbi:hypothetical protein CDAR_248801 [Caerostris darwini]|uniref:Uncharacterized protein n=1 Tax=Caerostris darwini TaxID=1538125 RepID=A0AAV4VN87_9ARAC|nr:hypothetical protein CDAR_248801 [Caerostris darwini]